MMSDPNVSTHGQYQPREKDSGRLAASVRAKQPPTDAEQCQPD